MAAPPAVSQARMLGEVRLEMEVTLEVQSLSNHDVDRTETTSHSKNKFKNQCICVFISGFFQFGGNSSEIIEFHLNEYACYFC